MTRVRIEGKNPLNGQYQPSGNPNAAMALLAGAMLTTEPVRLHNWPDTTSTQTMQLLAARLGAKVAAPAERVLVVQAEQINRRVLTPADTSSFVSSLLFLAPMLLRRQHVRVEVDFPLNRIRTHLEALRDLGQDVTANSGAVEIQAAQWDKKEILLTQASVTATALVMMLAACSGQETIVHNAACEPHVQELADLLCEMGAHIEGIGSNVLRIISPPELHGAEVTIGPDHIEAASIAAVGALAGGRVQIDGIRRGDMQMIAKTYSQFGIHLDMDETVLFVPKHETLSLSNREEDLDLTVETAPWPAFPSDLVAMATVVATQARGSVLVHEKLFNNRLLFVDKLKAMGAQIVLCDPHRVIVVGPTPLHGIYMDSPDVRAGLGLLAAALIAQGESVIDNADVIERTFAGVYQKLQALGAKVTVE